MAELGNVAHQLAQVLVAMRNSLERISRYRNNAEMPREVVSKIVGQIEEIRFNLGTHYRSISPDKLSIDAFRIANKELSVSLSKILSNQVFVKIADKTPFRGMPSASIIAKNLTSLDPIFNEKINLHQATNVLYNLSINFSNNSNINNDEIIPTSEVIDHDAQDTNFAIENLKRIVPSQKLAPLQFSIENNKLVIENNNSSSLEEDKNNISAAKEKIISNGAYIIESLKSSNCDRRLLDSIKVLHDQISNDSNAIQIGISNISCGMISDMFRNELPDAVSGLLKAHNLSVNMYVAQFPDWNRFSENAMAAEIDNNDISKVAASAGNIIDYMKKNEDIADVSVLRSFKQINKIVSDPARSTKRAVFAVIRTIENLISKIFHYTISYFEQVASQTVDGLAKATSKVLVGSIVALAVVGSSNLIGISSKINELSWIKNAIEIVQKQMKELK